MLTAVACVHAQVPDLVGPSKPVYKAQDFFGEVRLRYGSPATGLVLTSIDEYGTARWQSLGAAGIGGIYGGPGSIPSDVPVDLNNYLLSFSAGRVSIGTDHNLESGAGSTKVTSTAEIEFHAPTISFKSNAANWVPAASSADVFNGFSLGFNSSSGNWFRAPGPNYQTFSYSEPLASGGASIALTAGTVSQLPVPATSYIAGIGNLLDNALPAGTITADADIGFPVEISGIVTFIPASTGIYELVVGINDNYVLESFGSFSSRRMSGVATCTAGQICTLVSTTILRGTIPAGTTFDLGLNTTVSNTVNSKRMYLKAQLIK